MRDFFIGGFEILVGIIIVLLGIGILFMAGAAAFGTGSVAIPGMPALQAGGPLAGLLILVGGFLYLIFLGGLMYLGLGIYQNTKKAAAALERMAGTR